ncbi:hypothetical protein [Streptomyces tsukubensis]|uniref:hypothetical protein n=1 Tax=Streptomyces tsukubensis TaxID=83656 RepID=UPI00344F05AD
MSDGPEFLDREYETNHQRIVIYFRDRVNESGTRPYACWSRGAEQAVLYTAEGLEHAVLPVSPAHGYEGVLAEIAEEWGALLWVKFSDRPASG